MKLETLKKHKLIENQLGNRLGVQLIESAFK